MQISFLNINLVNKHLGFHDYHLPFHIKIHIETIFCWDYILLRKIWVLKKILKFFLTNYTLLGLIIKQLQQGIKSNGHTQKSNRYLILYFKQIAKYTNIQKLHETSKQNKIKSNKYNIKPGRMEQYYKNTKYISWEKYRF